jgi:sterol desaturase/sphingolipid hydroxylase (fatty acid hydroxylase superfamily)
METYVIIPFLVHLSSFWFFCGLFYYYDKKFINKSINNKEKYKKAIKYSLFNQLCITLPILYLYKDITEFTIKQADNYSLLRNILNVFLIGNLSNIFFYIIHRLFHINYFYKRIHNIHHEFIEPVAPSALYAHPLEHIFANTLPFLFGYLICGGCSYYITLLLICFGSFITTIAHVNHNIDFFGDEHIFHHKYFKYNFGFGGYLDRILKTNYNKYLENNKS